MKNAAFLVLDRPTILMAHFNMFNVFNTPGEEPPCPGVHFTSEHLKEVLL